MNLTWLAACGTTAFMFTAGIAVADQQQFGPFADDHYYSNGFDVPSQATEDTKAEVYGDAYEHDYLYGDEYIDDYEPELWVGMQPRFYVD